MESIDVIYSEIEKVLVNQQISLEQLRNLELRIKEFRRSISSSKMNAQDSQSYIEGTTQHCNVEQQQEIQITWFSEKQIQKLLNLTSNDSNRFSKTYICGSIMLMCFDNELIQIESIENVRLIINLINTLCNLIDKLNGLEMCFQLGSMINTILNYLIKQTELSAEYKDYLNKMKQNPIINGSKITSNFIQYEKRINQMAMADDIASKKQAVNLIFDLFSECISYSEQLTLFSYSITNILKDIVRIPINFNEQEEEAKSLMILLAKFVLTLLVIPETQIEFDPNTLIKHMQEDKIEQTPPTNKNNSQPSPRNKSNSQSTPNSKNSNPQSPISKNSTDNYTVDKSLEYFFHSKDNFLQVIQKQGTKTDRQMGNVLNYSIRGIKEIITQSEHIYGNVELVFNSLLLFPAQSEIMRYCLSILKNLFKQFPNFRKKLQSPIMTVLQNISSINDPECQQSAANFLYEIINNPQYEDESFIYQLAQNEKIMQIKNSTFYDSKYVSCTLFNKQIFQFEDLVIHKTFAMQQSIEAEKSYCYHLEIKKPFSIVYVGFATQSNDIKVTFQKLEDFGNSQISKRESINVIHTFLSQRINCEQDPYRLVLLAEKKGIYKIEFDNTYSWYNSKLLRFRCLVLEPDISNGEILRKKLLLNQVKFDQMDLNLFKKFDGNWCQLYLMNHSIDVQVDTADKQTLRKVITQVDFQEVDKLIINKFQTFYKQDYLSILIIYEKSALQELLNNYASKLVSEGYHSQKEVEQNLGDRSFQMQLMQRYMHDNFSFLSQFKSLSLEIIEDINYFWYKNGSNFLAEQIYSLNNIPATGQSNSETNISQETILICKSNPSSSSFQLKLFHQNSLHQVDLQDLDDEIYETYEQLMNSSDTQQYFDIFCEFIYRFLVYNSSIGISKIIFYLDPSNMFWTDNQLMKLKQFFDQNLPQDINDLTLIKSTL